MSQKVVSKSILGIWLQIAQQSGLNVSDILEHSNLSFDEEFISFEQFCSCITHIIQKSEAECIGLQVGKQLNLTALGIVGQIIQSSQNLEEAIDKAAEHFNLISNGIALHIQKTVTHVLFTFTVDAFFVQKFPNAIEQLLTACMVFTYYEINYLTLKKQGPSWVKTTLHDADQRLAFANTFATEIISGSDQHCIAFPIQILAEKILYADYELLLALEQLACKRYTQQIQHSTQFSDTVKSIIYTLINPSFPTLEDIAQQMHMSKRTVQRKLKEEGYSYSDIIIEIKKSIAIECLEKQLSIKETSYIVGYSESSAFVNAFKLWFGTTPLQYQLKE